MSITTAIPVPSEPQPVPNRWVSVADDPDGDSYCYQTSYAVARGSRRWHKHSTEYLLPGTDLAAALAELERASEALEDLNRANILITLDELVEVWREARRKVKALTPKGTNP